MTVQVLPEGLVVFPRGGAVPPGALVKLPEQGWQEDRFLLVKEVVLYEPGGIRLEGFLATCSAGRGSRWFATRRGWAASKTQGLHHVRLHEHVPCFIPRREPEPDELLPF